MELQIVLRKRMGGEEECGGDAGSMVGGSSYFVFDLSDCSFSINHGDGSCYGI